MIRPARPDDVPTILALIRELAEYERASEHVEASEESLRDSLFGPDPAVFCHIAEHDGPEGGTAGFALWFLNFSTWTGRHGIYVEDLYVRPHQRGHGHGAALLRELARTATERGYGRMEWWVLDWNEPAIRFYERIGAAAMDEWTVWRLSGPDLRHFAANEGEAAGRKP